MVHLLKRRAGLRLNVFPVQRHAAFEDDAGFAEPDDAVLYYMGYEECFKGLFLLWPEHYPLFALAPALREAVSEPEQPFKCRP